MKIRWVKRLIHPDDNEFEREENEISFPMDDSGLYVFAKLQYLDVLSIDPIWTDVEVVYD